MKDMVRKDRCCFGICNNDRSYPNKLEIKSHVLILKWHIFPKDKAKRNWWQTLVDKGWENFVASDESRICSNYCWREANKKTPQPHYAEQQAVSFSFLWICFILGQKTLPAISHTHQSIDWEKDYDTIKDCSISLVFSFI